MVSSIDNFKLYIGVHEEDETLISIFLDAAESIVSEYLNDNLETSYPNGLPGIITLTIFRIGALLNTESNSNIGISSKSLVDGSRTFFKTTDYTVYLNQIARFVKV